MAKRKPAAHDTDSELREVGEKLHAAIMSIELHGEGEHQSTTAELARLSVAYTTVRSELRQSAKASLKQLESYPISDLVARLKALSDEERKEIARDISGETEEESLL